ncbi:anthranilate synthase component I [Gonapodya prolifera JEL478]|uniref:anthranilate synthase n=1 Tax=Gonapodya prolifera (strain JEL478) TaxID=1344416 RepID=A0A139ALF7_GONPJ|nr:anthranilate synthase component I [Gonapodya prolifera JEL478]|eukprot:KXS17590.1 anthranilate synthase component I [Gonapodya prolifera JEL478]
MSSSFKPSLSEVQSFVASGVGNTIPVFQTIAADLLTPVSAYLKVASSSPYSFLLESVAGGEKIGRYSFLGAHPYDVVKTGEKFPDRGDPLKILEERLKSVKIVKYPGVLNFTGGAIGYIAYDCVQYFEPRTRRDLADPLGIPDAVFMFCDTVIIFDHLTHVITVVTHMHIAEGSSPDIVVEEYNRAVQEILKMIDLLNAEVTPLPKQAHIELGNEGTSNVGEEGYKKFVTSLKHHINEGDIIQAVPSQRIARPTTLHPFNAYRQLRSVNPSPYMFYVDLNDFQLVGASPEMLVKVEDGKVVTHPIAGTRKRGKSSDEDNVLAEELLADIKERAEHIMLVDLGRNDVNRVCRPETCKVDSLMHIERYSHVMHIVSHVSGQLRPGKTGFDAFRSIFPAGTVSGAPKVRAMELIYELEREKRGIYAGSVGFFDYAGNIDTCIAIRTMLFKNGVAYLQAGGGIVYDSDPDAEYEETINKLKSNITALARAELHYSSMQKQEEALTLKHTAINGAIPHKEVLVDTSAHDSIL